MRVRTILTTLFAILVVAGCASAPEKNGPASDLVIQVESLSAGMAGVAIHLISPVGGRRFIGMLPADGNAVFGIHEPVMAGEYRLVAEAPNGRQIASRPFTLREPGVRWNVTNNTVFPLG